MQGRLRMVLMVVVLGLLAWPSSAWALGGGTLGSADATFTGEAEFDIAGNSVAGAGDVNGDGYDDLLVGAPGTDAGGDGAGAAYLVLGGASGWGAGKPLGQTPIIRYTGEAAGDNAGESVAGAGDVNGDGYDDLLIGAPRAFAPDDSAGAAYLVLGSASPASASLATAIQFTGAAANDSAGDSVAGAGDVNGDGLADLLFGAVGNDAGGDSAGAAYLVFSDYLSPDSPAYRERHRLRANGGDALPVTFEQARVRVDFTAGALPEGDVSVLRHLFDPCETARRLAMPIWTLDSTKVGSGTTATLRFEYTDGQLAEMTEANLSLWFRPAGQPCAPWIEVGGTVDAAHNALTISGVPQGDYTLADVEPPTALGVERVGMARSGGTGWYAVLPALVILGLWVVAHHLRQRTTLRVEG